MSHFRNFRRHILMAGVEQSPAAPAAVLGQAKASSTSTPAPPVVRTPIFQPHFVATHLRQYTQPRLSVSQGARMTPSPFSKAPKRRLNWTCPLLKSWFGRAWKRFSTHARGRGESANLRREENLAAESMSSEHDSVESRRAQSSVVVLSRQSSSRLVAKKLTGVVQGIPPTALVIQLNRAFQHVSQNEIKL